MRPAPGELRTIYFGGGTPSLMSGEQVARLVAAARDRWTAVALEEVTLEANPSERETPDWAGLRDRRASTASASASSRCVDADLVALARGHTAREARRGLRGGPGGRLRQRQHRSHLWDPRPVARWLARRPRPRRSSSAPTTSAATPCSSRSNPTSGPPRRGRARCAGGTGWCRARTTGWRPSSIASRRSFWAVPATRTTSSARGRCPVASRVTTAPTGRGARTPASAPGRTPTTASRSARGTPATSTCTSTRATAGERPIEASETLDEPTRAFEAIALGLRRVAGLSRREFAVEFGADPVDRYAEAVEADDDHGAPRCRRRRPAPVAGRTAPRQRRARGVRLMMLSLAVLRGVADGSIDRAFRRWERPRVRAGGSQRTGLGVIGFTSVETIERDALTNEDAERAGLRSLDRAAGDARPAAGAADLPHRPRARRAGPASRAARRRFRRRTSRPRSSRSLERLDRASRHGPWTRAVLEAIRDRPSMPAADLAASFGREKLPFKLDVRKLKELGLTESLRPGYRLSPRGQAVLARAHERRSARAVAAPRGVDTARAAAVPMPLSTVWHSRWQSANDSRRRSWPTRPRNADEHRSVRRST